MAAGPLPPYVPSAVDSGEELNAIESVTDAFAGLDPSASTELFEWGRGIL